MVEREISFGGSDSISPGARCAEESPLRLDRRVRDWVRIAEDRAWLRAVYSRRAEVRALSEGPHWIEPPSEGGKVRNRRLAAGSAGSDDRPELPEGV